jgi:thymidine kinase
MGTLQIIVGCMYAGKTTKLIDLAEEFLNTGKTVRLYKPDIDKRYHTTKIMTHDGRGIDASVVSLHEPEIIIEDVDALFIDAPVIKDHIMQALSKSVDVVVSGLNKDFRGEPFQTMGELMPHADNIIFLHATCQKCGGKAQMTQRLINNEPPHYNDPIIMVGSVEAYEARCKGCHEVRRD